MAARYERGLFDPDAPAGTSPFDHHIYVIASDGDMEEGVTSEASSLAGTQQLGNLIVIWDDNKISIEHDTKIAFTEDTPARYEAYGWHVQFVEGGENVTGIEEAIANAKAVTDRPSFIAVRTIIGYPAPTKMNTGGCMARRWAPRRWPPPRRSRVRSGQEFRRRRRRHRPHAQAGRSRPGGPRDLAGRLRRLGSARTGRKALLDRCWPAPCLRVGTRVCRTGNPAPRRWPPGPPPVKCCPRSARRCPNCGAVRPTSPAATTPRSGSPVLRPAVDLHPRLDCRLVHPAFRYPQHAMGSILSGIVLHGPTRAYGGTFLQFADYMRGAVPGSAMDIPTIYVWTHDFHRPRRTAPHQPIEHLAALRSHPRLSVVRPRTRTDGLRLARHPGAHGRRQ